MSFRLKWKLFHPAGLGPNKRTSAAARRFAQPDDMSGVVDAVGNAVCAAERAAVSHSAARRPADGVLRASGRSDGALGV